MRYLLLTSLIAIPVIMMEDRCAGQSQTKPSVKDLPAKQVRITLRKLLDVGGSFVQEVTFETSEPVEVSVTLQKRSGSGGGGGSVFQTKRREGQRLATTCVLFSLFYQPRGKEKDKKENRFVKKSFLRFAVNELGGNGEAKSGSETEPVEAPDATYLSEIMWQKLKSGNYPYAGRDAPADNTFELLSVGEYRVVLRFSELSPKGEKKTITIKGTIKPGK